MTRMWRPAAVLLAVPLLGGAGPGDPAPAMPALSAIMPGQWELVSKDDPSASRSLCLSDPRMLIQLRHPAQSCTRFVISSEAKSVTIHYKCAGAGHGLTTIRVETPRLVQIQSQGVAANAPFLFSAEGRRVGACQAPARLGSR